MPHTNTDILSRHSQIEILSVVNATHRSEHNTNFLRYILIVMRAVNTNTIVILYYLRMIQDILISRIYATNNVRQWWTVSYVASPFRVIRFWKSSSRGFLFLICFLSTTKHLSQSVERVSCQLCFVALRPFAVVGKSKARYVVVVCISV